MEVLGCHLLLELKDCNSELLNDLSYIRQAMIETAQDVGATIVGESFHHFSPQGVTGILAIAESHISIGNSDCRPSTTNFPAGLLGHLDIPDSMAQRSPYRTLSRPRGPWHRPGLAREATGGS